ncbi:MAG: NAD(P)H-binding protein [Alphaproteobacteria bacterium]|nr:NAD(P)H-binding protein [Alphaproteobacteria bacterium]
MTKPVVLVGGGGWLGRQIASELDARGLSVRLLLRGGEAHPKADELRKRLTRAPTIIDGDISAAAGLQRAVDGVETVISAVQGGPDVIIDGQAALARAAQAAGAKRMFPSDFSVDFTIMGVEEHLFLGWRKLAQAAIADAGIAQTNTYNGAFMEMLTQDFFGLVDWARREITHWGDPDQVYDFTTTADTARFVAAAAASKNELDGPFRIAGDRKSPRQIAETLTAAKGAAFSVRQLGDLAALDAEISRRHAQSPDNPMRWAGLQYHRAMASGRGALHNLHNNLFPDIAPMTISAFASAPPMGAPS